MADQFTVSVRMNATDSGVSKATADASRELDELKSSAGGASQAMEKHGRAVDSSKQGHDQLARSGRASVDVMRSMGGVVAQLAAGFSAFQVLSIADKMQQFAQQTRTATKDTGDFQEMWDRLQASALRTGTALEANVQSFQGLARVAEQIGATNTDVLAVTEAFAGLGRIGGASTEAMSNSMFQFVQAMGSGILQAEEFNSIIDQTPEVIFTIAENMGMTVGELTKAVKSGGVLAEDVFGALLKAAPQVAADLADIPDTIATGTTKLATAIGSLVHHLDEATKTSSTIGSFFGNLAEAITPVTETARVDAFLDAIRVLREGGAEAEQLIDRLALAYKDKYLGVGADFIRQTGRDQEKIIQLLEEEAAQYPAVVAALKTLNDERGKSVATVPKAIELTKQESQALKSLLDALNPLEAEAREYAEAQELLNKAHAAGDVSVLLHEESLRKLWETTTEYTEQLAFVSEAEREMIAEMEEADRWHDELTKAREKEQQALEKQEDKLESYIEKLEFEVSLIGLSAADREKAIQLRKFEAVATEEHKEKIGGLIEKLEDEKLQQDALALAWEQAGKRIDESFFKVFRAGFQDVDSLLSALGDTVGDLAAEIAYGGLKDALLGTGGSPAGTPQSFFGPLFGGQDLTTGQQLGIAAGVGAGTIGGAQAGGGGQFSQLGAAAGSLLPLLLISNPWLAAAAALFGGVAGGSLGGIFDDGDEKPKIAVRGELLGPEGPARAGDIGARGVIEGGPLGNILVSGLDGQPRSDAMRQFARRVISADTLIADRLGADQIDAASQAAMEAVNQDTRADRFDPGATLLARVDAIFEATDSLLGDLWGTIQDIDPTNAEQALQSVVSLHDFLGTSFEDQMESAQETMRLASETLFDTLSRTGEDLAKLAIDFDGSAESMAALSLTAESFALMERELIIQTEQARRSITQGSSNLRERFQRDTETDVETYNRLVARAEEEIARISELEDPVAVAAAARQVQEDLGAAWALLTPEQREQFKGQFDDFLDSLDEISGSQLDATVAAIQQQGEAVRDAVREGLLPVSETLDDVARSMSSATQTLRDAAAMIPREIVVQVEDSVT